MEFDKHHKSVFNKILLNEFEKGRISSFQTAKLQSELDNNNLIPNVFEDFQAKKSNL